MSTDTRPSLGRHIDRVSVNIWAECWSPYRSIVSTNAWPTDALSTHDPLHLICATKGLSALSLLGKNLFLGQIEKNPFLG